MSQTVTLDVLDRPAGGVLRARRAWRRLAEGGGPPGSVAMLPLMTVNFVPTVIPSPTPRRIALLSVWEDAEACDRFYEAALDGVLTGARERWHVRGEVARTSFTDPWRGWEPDASGSEPLDPAEPVMVMISGDLRAKAVPSFVRASARVVAQASGHAGYLGGLGLQSTVLNTTSCSAWRSVADARDFAWSNGAHSVAARQDRAFENHIRECFVHLRPVVSRGTLVGVDPFAGLLRTPVAS
jgi:hypothetical protein